MPSPSHPSFRLITAALGSLQEEMARDLRLPGEHDDAQSAYLEDELIDAAREYVEAKKDHRTASQEGQQIRVDAAIATLKQEHSVEFGVLIEIKLLDDPPKDFDEKGQTFRGVATQYAYNEAVDEAALLVSCQQVTYGFYSWMIESITVVEG